jgi:hypothetical protein
VAKSHLCLFSPPFPMWVVLGMESRSEVYDGPKKSTISWTRCTPSICISLSLVETYSLGFQITTHSIFGSAATPPLGVSEHTYVKRLERHSLILPWTRPKSRTTVVTYIQSVRAQLITCHFWRTRTSGHSISTVFIRRHLTVSTVHHSAIDHRVHCCRQFRCKHHTDESEPTKVDK